VEKWYGIIFYLTLCLVLLCLVGLFAYETMEDLESRQTFVLIIVLSGMIFGRSVTSKRGNESE
jgi:prolipoprotein diacylglyceryltransferase